MQFKGLIFDFNGVLLLDQHLHDEIWKRRATELTGREVSDDEIRQYLHGRTNQGVLEYLLGKSLSHEEVDTYATEKENEYQELARSLGSEYQLAPGAVPLLDVLKERGIPIAIATSSPKMNAEFFDTTFGLSKWFGEERIVCHDGTFSGKPAPDIYLRAAAALGLKPEECVVIEDARSGIAAAHAAGIGYIIAIGLKETHDALRAIEGVSAVVESLSEVRAEEMFTSQ